MERKFKEALYWRLGGFWWKGNEMAGRDYENSRVITSYGMA